MYSQQANPQQPVYPGYPGYQAGTPPGFVPQGPGPNISIPVGDVPGWARGPSGYSMFSEKSIRNAFVSKVYTILTVQLAFTVILIGIFISNENIKRYFLINPFWMFLGLGIFIVSYLILVCVESARRSFPTNFILLAILTIGMSLEAAIISCLYSTQIVLYAAFTCAISTLLITLFSKHSSFDMTRCGCVLFTLAIIHMFLGFTLSLIMLATGYGNVANMIMAIFGAFLVMCYLIFDTQLIMGGRKHELSAEEYILGAILLYVDIVTMFLYLLEIFQRTTGDD